MFRLLLAFIAVFALFFEGCGGVGRDDEERYDRDRERRGRDFDDFEDSEDEDGDFLEEGEDEDLLNFDGEDGEGADGLSSAPAPVEPLKQKGLSNKIDFLFIIDASPENRPYTQTSVLDEKIGILPSQLTEMGINWRFYFLNAEFKESKNAKKAGRNAKLTDLENSGGLIIFQYLNQALANNYFQGQARSIFISTISHPDSKSRNQCGLPPYCHKKNDTRPLTVLKKFLSQAQNILRQDADLISVILTNRDEVQPKKGGWFRGKKDVPLMDAGLVVDEFKNNYSDKKFYAANIVVESGSTECKNQVKQNIFASYIPQLSLFTEGALINICSASNNGYAAPLLRMIQSKRGSRSQ